MQRLEKRVSTLEGKKKTNDAFTLIRRIVSPGQVNAEIYRLRDDDGRLWTRQTGETEPEFVDRAALEVKRNPLGIARLLALD